MSLFLFEAAWWSPIFSLGTLNASHSNDQILISGPVFAPACRHIHYIPVRPPLPPPGPFFTSHSWQAYLPELPLPIFHPSTGRASTIANRPSATTPPPPSEQRSLAPCKGPPPGPEQRVNPRRTSSLCLPHLLPTGLCLWSCAASLLPPALFPGLGPAHHCAWTPSSATGPLPRPRRPCPSALVESPLSALSCRTHPRPLLDTAPYPYTLDRCRCRYRSHFLPSNPHQQLPRLQSRCSISPRRPTDTPCVHLELTSQLGTSGVPHISGAR